MSLLYENADYSDVRSCGWERYTRIYLPVYWLIFFIWPLQCVLVPVSRLHSTLKRVGSKWRLPFSSSHFDFGLDNGKLKMIPYKYLIPLPNTVVALCVWVYVCLFKKIYIYIYINSTMDYKHCFPNFPCLCPSSPPVIFLLLPFSFHPCALCYNDLWLRFAAHRVWAKPVGSGTHCAAPSSDHNASVSTRMEGENNKKKKSYCLGWSWHSW